MPKAKPKPPEPGPCDRDVHMRMDATTLEQIDAIRAARPELRGVSAVVRYAVRFTQLELERGGKR